MDLGFLTTELECAQVHTLKFNAGRIKPVNRIVIHTAECPIRVGAARNVASWLAGATAPNASAHFVVDPGTTVQCVSVHDTAWHAGPANGRSIGIEHVGYAKFTEAQWAEPDAKQMLERSAALIYVLCNEFSIEPRWLLDAEVADPEVSGILGHDQITRVLKTGTHWDPGPHFPRAQLIEHVLYLKGNLPPGACV